ncbi:short-chain dehydrogenase, partial [Vibrio cholerae]
MAWFVLITGSVCDEVGEGAKVINIIDKRVEERIPAVLRLGFRPFFLLGSVYAVVAIVAWVWMFQTGQP